MSDVTELIFPRNNVAPGAFPERLAGDPSPSSTASQGLDFKRADYEGWGDLDKANERMKWVLDPGGSGETVLQMDVYGDDVADQWGGCRATIGSSLQSERKEGSSGYQALAVYLPSNFQFPDQWMLIWQNFSTGGNPPQAIELRPPPTGGSIRNYWWAKLQKQPTSDRVYYPVAPIVLGRWHYFLMQLLFTTSKNGFFKLWHKLDVMPDPAMDNPKVNQSGLNTLYSGGEAGSKTWLAMYRGASGHTQHQTMLYRGFRQSAKLDVVRAMR